MSSGAIKFIILLLAALVMLVNSAGAADQLRDSDEQVGSTGNDRNQALPKSLLRLLRAEPRGPYGFRVGDSMIMNAMGKRSELLNLEPLYGRYGFRNLPRMSDLRWAPFGAYDSSSNDPAYSQF